MRGNPGLTALLLAGTDLTLWGPGVRPDPLSCSAGSAMLRVTYELGKEAR
jgi:hypothetical protein